MMMAHLLRSVGRGSDRLAERGWCQIAAWHSYFGGVQYGMGVLHALGHTDESGCTGTCRPTA